MTNPLIRSDYYYDTEAGYFVSEKHRRVAEIVRDYNPELTLMWVPHANRTAEDVDKPYVVVHTHQNGNQYPVFYCDEADMDEPERVLIRLFAGDRSKQLNILDMIEIKEQAEAILKEKEWEEKRAEAREELTTIMNSPLHTFKHNGKKFYPKGR